MKIEIATLAGGPARNAVATLAGGCFWCTEAIYKRLKGRKDKSHGYPKNITRALPLIEQGLPPMAEDQTI